MASHSSMINVPGLSWIKLTACQDRCAVQQEDGNDREKGPKRNAIDQTHSQTCRLSLKGVLVD